MSSIEKRRSPVTRKRRICPGVGRCPYPLRGERRWHSCLPSRSDWPCRLERSSPAARRRLSGVGRARLARRSAPRSDYGRIGVVSRGVHVPYVVEQDEDGVWCASALLRPGVGAVGDGPNAVAASSHLRIALEHLIAGGGLTDDVCSPT